MSAREAAILPYLILSAVLVLAVLFLLPGRPVRPYVRIFFFAGMLCIGAEALIGTLLGFYSVRAGLISDPVRDSRLADFLVNTSTHSLMAVLFVRLAPRRPVEWAVAGAVALGFLEIWFVRHGYVTYRMWHPAISSVHYFGLFMVSWQVYTGRWALPTWVHVFSMASWLIVNASLLLQGVLGLWQYPLALHGGLIVGGQVASNLYEMTLVVPIATLVAVVPSYWPRAVLVAGGAGFLLLAQTLLLTSGRVVFVHWNLWLSALLYVVELGLVSLYARRGVQITGSLIL